MSDQETTAVAVREAKDVTDLTAADPKTASPEQYGLVLAAVQAVKARMKRIADHYAPIKAGAYASWKGICKQESDDLRPCQDAEKRGKRWMDDRDNEVERIAREEQARLRREQEARERAAREESERLAREAEKLAAKGKAEAAERARKEAEAKAREAETVANLPTPVVEVPKEAGTARREVWGAYEIEDQSLIPRDFLMPDHDKLKRYAQAMRADAKVAGVRFYPTYQRAVSK